MVIVHEVSKGRKILMEKKNPKKPINIYRENVTCSQYLHSNTRKQKRMTVSYPQYNTAEFAKGLTMRLREQKLSTQYFSWVKM